MFRSIAFIILTVCVGVLNAEAGPIYVFREPDGTVRFTDKPPPSGVKTQIFTGRSTLSSFSRSRATSSPIYGAKVGRKKHKLFTEEYDPIIRRAALFHGIDPYLVRAVIHAESAFNPKAVSPKGARGLMQLMPGTASDMGVKNPFNPVDNVWGGTRYLKELLAKFRGSTILALAAYNAGHANVDQYGGIPPFAETQGYVRRVLALQQQYRSVSQARG
jgi:soluble lytic murein transglycosylase-like protein